MKDLYLWLGLEKLVLKCYPTEFREEVVVKICCINKNVFVLTKCKEVYYGALEDAENNETVLKIMKSTINAIDISSNSQHLFFVNESGRVFKTSPGNVTSWEEIVLKEDAKCCVHGYKMNAREVKVKSIAVTDSGCLYVTENGQLWASGDHMQLNIQGDEPKPVLFFDKRYVKAVSCGSDFSLVLVQKPSQNSSNNEKDDTDDEDDAVTDVFVSTCPTCVVEYVSSPVSQPSTSDTCPLGLHVQQTNNNNNNTLNSSTSTASKDNTAEDSRKSSDESTSVSVTEEPTHKESFGCNSENRMENGTGVMETIPKDHQSKDDERDVLSESSKDDVVKPVVADTETEPGSDSPKLLERKNEFFINTDAARQFLTRQLSWVSSYGGAGEELLVECAEASLVRPSRIIKQNVTNMASLVYEGVKTVGDRVVTLSRHMSGGSETSESVPGLLTDFESFEDLSTEDMKSTAVGTTFEFRCEEFVCTSSPGTSERGEESDMGMIDERVSSLVRAGTGVLAVELWAWGGVYHGQLGTGDTIKKTRPCIVSRLSGIGVCRIACGYSHAAAVTLDGRVFAWGKNSSSQVSADSTSDQSSPQQICNLTRSERVRDVAAGASHTVIQTNEGKIYYMGKQGTGISDGVFTHLDTPTLEGSKVSQKKIFASKSITGCLSLGKAVSLVVQDLSIEQSFLEEAILVHNGVIKPMQKRGGMAQENTVYESLCVCYSELLGLTALNVTSLWECAEYGTEASNVIMVLNVDEHVRVYRNYLNVLCDVISISGFVHIAKLVDISPKLISVFSERTQLRKTRKSPEITVSVALTSPLVRLNVYKCMIQSLLGSNACSDQAPGVKRQVEKKLRDALSKWEQMWEEQDKRKREADTTRQFWESSGRLMELLRSPDRRLVRESKSHALSVSNSGRFSSHWIVLLTDVLVHVVGSTQTVHPLTTVWVEPLQDSDTVQNAITLTMPEESVTLCTPTANDKKEWVHCLQTTIKRNLQKSLLSHQPPAVRTATYTFTKHSFYKDAKYIGRWCNGKLQGPGKMVWADGKVYIGQFQNNLMHGYGCLEIPSISTYEGQWRDGQQNGLGIIKYACGDVYEGHFKDGQAHGHGVRKQGHFMASVASVYIGEWVAGVKQGYGVMDDIVTGEKYLGCWSNNMKHGCGLIVTLDGIYYEGVFMQDVLTGHGVMVFEDGTHYEGEFKSAGVFSGRGVLTFNSGDRLEGTLHGAWNEGVKVTGTLHKVTSAVPSAHLSSKPQSFGKLCVAANQKWKAIFRQCYQQLGAGEQPTVKPGINSNNKSGTEVQKVWENVAVVITNSRQEKLLQCGRGNKSKGGHPIGDSLDTIPQFGIDSLDKEAYQDLRKYLFKAFESAHHPLGMLLSEVTTAYTATYGGVRVHPLLLSHAVEELHSITGRVYEVVRLLFPALPLLGQELLLGGYEEQDEWCLSNNQVVSCAALLHPVLLPRVHSALFVLYALHNKQEDDAYWKRLLKWNKQPDTTLMAFLGIDQKFWIQYSSPKKNAAAACNIDPAAHSFSSPLREQLFHEAVETLQQLKTTFSPLEKLLVIRSTFEQMTRAVQQELGTNYLWTMDDLFPVFHFVVVRSQILQLGSEIHFIEDFMEPYLQNGELGIMFTTLKACYYQILQEKVSMSS